MADHSVTVDHSATPSQIEYSPVFNVAVTMIDRHLAEGRGGYPAIINADVDANADPEEGVERQVTYQQLAERVNRCGNMLRSLASEPGGRILMVVKDCPEFFYIFWGAIKAGTSVKFTNGTVRSSVNTAMTLNDQRGVTRALKAQKAGKMRSILGSSPNFATKAIEASYIAVAHTDCEADIRNLIYTISR